MKIDFICLESLSKEERDSLLVRYRKLFSLIYGKTIADLLLDTFNSNNKFISSFSENHYRAELALDKEYNKRFGSMHILLVYNNNELSMAGRVIKGDNFFKLCEVVLFKKDVKLNSKLYNYLLSFLKGMAKEGDTINIEILNDNTILKYVSYDNNFRELTYLNDFRHKQTTCILERKKTNEN